MFTNTLYINSFNLLLFCTKNYHNLKDKTSNNLFSTAIWAYREYLTTVGCNHKHPSVSTVETMKIRGVTAITFLVILIFFLTDKANGNCETKSSCSECITTKDCAWCSKVRLRMKCIYNFWRWHCTIMYLNIYLICLGKWRVLG